MSINISIGTPTANSYVSVASANAYIESRQNNEQWLNISVNASTSTYATTWKENLLKQATREIDRSFRFHNEKYNQGERGQDTYQNLEFPRWTNQDANGDLYIPDEVKFATYEQALWILNRAGLKTTDEGTPIQRHIINIDCRNYLKEWINRQVLSSGKHPWEGSDY
jgi:hypothetical protein